MVGQMIQYQADDGLTVVRLEPSAEHYFLTATQATKQIDTKAEQKWTGGAR